MDEIKSLELFGLTKNESKVYHCLIRYGDMGAGKIIKELRIHRNIVYESLDKLIEKGLISYVFEGKIKKFHIESPDILISMANEQLETDRERLKLARDIKSKIENARSDENRQETFLYRGTKGVKAVMNLHLKENKDYLVLGSPKESVDLMPEGFWEGFNLGLKEKKIQVKMIFNLSLKEWSNNIISHSNEIRFLPDKFDSITQINVGESFVALFVWTPTPIVTVIYDKNLVKSYKNYFEVLWKIAKK